MLANTPSLPAKESIGGEVPTRGWTPKRNDEWSSMAAMYMMGTCGHVRSLPLVLSFANHKQDGGPIDDMSISTPLLSLTRHTAQSL